MFGPVSEGMRIFRSKATIAVVGYSNKENRVSNKISQYLLREGNSIIGINPNINGMDGNILVVPSLADLKDPVDMIQVFRNSDALPVLAEEIAGLSWRPKMVWCQQGVFDVLFQQRLERIRIPVVMDACPYALRSYL